MAGAQSTRIARRRARRRRWLRRAAATVALTIATTSAGISAAEPSTHDVASRDRAFVDEGGTVRSFDEVHTAWFGPDRRPANPSRALLEVPLLLGIGTLYYWLDPLANRSDWDDPPFLDRFNGRAVRFDTNLNTTNHLLHAGAGALNYGLARDNGLPVLAAFGLSTASSALWEFVLEWHEKPSINDVVFTSVGGVPVGEFFQHLGEYVNSAPKRTLPTEIVASVAGFARRAHGAIDRDPAPAPVLPPDDLGFSSAFAHRFRVGYELAALTNDAGRHGSLHRIAADAEIIEVPGFLREGSFDLDFTRGAFSELDVRLGFGDTGLDEVDLRSRATLFGHYEQSFVRDERGVLRGDASMVGVGPGYRFNATKVLGRHDQLSTVHALGVHARTWIVRGPVNADIGLEVSGDFAALDSLAWQTYVAQFGRDGEKFVLQRQGYQYSCGVWSSVRGAVTVGPLKLDAAVGRGGYASIEGADRFQEHVTRDTPGAEEVLELEGHAAIVAGYASIGAGMGQRSRQSRLGPVAVTRVDRQVLASVGVVF